jgi:hypothetical protein
MDERRGGKEQRRKTTIIVLMRIKVTIANLTKRQFCLK